MKYISIVKYSKKLSTNSKMKGRKADNFTESETLIGTCLW